MAQPFAATQAPAPITETTATLNGMATPNGLPTSAWFEWGSSTNYEHATPAQSVGDGFGVVRVSAPITGLEAGTVYHCRLVSSNDHSVAYSTDRPFTAWRLEVWDADDNRLHNDAKDWGPLVSFAAGYSHVLALKTDGTVGVSGSYAYTAPQGYAYVPNGLSNVLAVAAGRDHSLALRGDGTVLAWGYNQYKQTNVPSSLADVLAIAAGDNHSLALRKDGTVAAWGSTSYGQTRVPSGLSNIVAIAAGESHSLALKADGTVVLWGSHEAVPTGLTNVVAIAAGASHSLALRADGGVEAWGENTYGQAQVPDGLSNVVAVAAGGNQSLALKTDGRVVNWGAILNRGRYVTTEAPAGLSNVASIVCTANHGWALRGLTAADYQPYAATLAAGPVTGTQATLRGLVAPSGRPTTAWFEWGTGPGYGQITPASLHSAGWGVTLTTASLDGLAPGTVYHCRLVSSNDHGVAYGADQPFATGLKVAAWGAPHDWRTTIPSSASNVVAIAVGGLHSFALRTDGVVVAWGYNNFGLTRVPAGLSNVIAIAASGTFSMALQADGHVAVWGSYWSEDARTLKLAYVPAGLSNVIAIAADGHRSFALRNDGSVACWGFTDLENLPVSNVVTVAAGNGYELLLRADGTIRGVGGGTGRSYQLPRIAVGATNLVAVAAGDSHAAALRADGTVVGWLTYDLDSGMPTLPLTNVPPGLDSAVAVAAGSWHSLALRADGLVVAWGYGGYGRTNVPTGLHGVVAIAAGREHSLALAPNVAPSLESQAWTVGVNQDQIVRLVATDPNNDPLTYRVASLPNAGSLFQYTPTGRGDPITTVGTEISDSLNRVVLAPAPGETGIPHAQFTIVANDGEDDSAPGTVTLNVIPPPAVAGGSFGPNASGTAFDVAFSGYSNTLYYVLASTNLIDWTSLGRADQPTPGQFKFSDVWVEPDGSGGSRTIWPGPMRFYRIQFYPHSGAP